MRYCLDYAYPLFTNCTLHSCKDPMGNHLFGNRQSLDTKTEDIESAERGATSSRGCTLMYGPYWTYMYTPTMDASMKPVWGKSQGNAVRVRACRQKVWISNEIGFYSLSSTSSQTIERPGCNKKGPVYIASKPNSREFQLFQYLSLIPQYLFKGKRS